MELRERWNIYKSTILWGWWKVGVIVFALAGCYDLLQGSFPSLRLPVLEQISDWLDWRIWIIIALLFAVIGTAEGAYRHIKKYKSEIEHNEREAKRLDLKNQRNIYVDRACIPEQLYNLFVMSQDIVIAKKDDLLIEQDKLNEIVLNLLQGGFINDSIFTQFTSIKTFQEMTKLLENRDALKTLQLINRTLIFIKRAMDDKEVGVTQLLKDSPEYSNLRLEIGKKSAILPNQTSNKIEDYFEIAVGINCLNLVDIDVSTAPPIATIMLQGYESSVERIIKPMISDIRNEIEKFLTGEMP